MKFLFTVFLVITLTPMIVFAQSQIESLSKEELNSIGIQLIKDQKYLEAIKYFDQALSMDPNDQIALTNKGAILTKLNNHEEALEYFDQALKIDPKNIKILSNKGATLVTLGKMNDALKVTKQILLIEPNDVKVLLAQANIYSNLERFSEATNTYERVLKIEPTNKFAIDYVHDNIISREPVSMKNTKFSGYVQIETRNSKGELISITESDTLKYLPYYLTDEYLDENELTRIVSINGIKYEERKFKETWHASEDVFLGRITLSSDKIGININLFESLPHAVTVEKGDTAIAYWTILRQVT